MYFYFQRKVVTIRLIFLIAKIICLQGKMGDKGYIKYLVKHTIGLWSTVF